MHELKMEMPSPVREAIERLERAGYRAYAVGGCVRDTLLSRAPNDWDVTTSARPEQTAACFADCRTIETGIRHGTLTVILDGMPLEITTFRNDGEYVDNRHPVSVTFSAEVEDDLSRRDFTVNAMAYHPTRGLVDLFDGQGDLARRVIACVGDPATRFCEDGLRILRAIRFASVLDFSLDPETEKAVHTHRALLHNIAAERIREELCKLLCGVGAERILREFSDVIGEFIPELLPCVGFAQNCRYHCYDVYEHSIRALGNATPDLVTRLALLLHDIGKPETYTEDESGGHFPGHGARSAALAETILRRLRFDNATAACVVRLISYHDREIPAEERAVKRLMCKLADEEISRLMEIRRCDRMACAEGYCTPDDSVWQIPRLVEHIRASDACLSLRTLAVKGDDLLGLGVAPGKPVGQMLASLLERVINGELPNEREALLAFARRALKA